MRIPSYDDLTPSIPDISPRETFAQVARVLPRSDHEPAARAVAIGAEPPPARLFACLRSLHVTGTSAASCDPRTRAASRQSRAASLTSIARDFSPRLERHGPGCVVLDVSGLGRLLGDPHAIGAELARAAHGIPDVVHVAVAQTQTAARLLAIAQPGLSVAAGDVAAAIGHLSIEALRVLIEDDGIAAGAAVAAREKATAARLDTFRRWGLATLGEVAALPPADLSERMGQDGLVLQRLARGVDRGPLVPDPGVRRFLESMELEWPVDALEPLSFVLARLLDPLSAALERADRGAAALRLDLRLVDRTIHARVLQLPAAMRDAKVLRTLLLLDLESHPPAAAIDIVTIEIDPAPARIVQYSLLERALPSAETVATLTARLGALVGESRCGSPALLDTYRPDAFEMRPFSPDARPAAVRPERRAGDACLVLRRFRPPIAVRVTVARGCPVRVAVDRRGMPGGQVQQHAGPWRSSGGWWDPAGAAWDRDEWDVALSDGSLCRLFRDRITDVWFMDGEVD